MREKQVLQNLFIFNFAGTDKSLNFEMPVSEELYFPSFAWHGNNHHYRIAHMLQAIEDVVAFESV